MTAHVQPPPDDPWAPGVRASDVPIVRPPPADLASILAPNKTDISAHLYALFAPAFVQAHPDSWIEIAYAKPDGKLNAAENFSAFDLEKAAALAEAKNSAGYNIYVGAALRHGTKPQFGRASGDHVLGASHAWAEYDGVGDDERISDILKSNNLAPPLVVTTGTVPCPRRHLYFKLDGGVTPPEKLEAANTALFKLLGSDAVQDAPRVMRLAGTINYPKPDKRAKGYVEELVTLHAKPTARAYRADELIGLAAPTKGATPNGENGRRDDGELVALLEASRTEWHNNMLRAVASMIGRGWSDLQIRLACAPYCGGGADDPDLVPLIQSARDKWGKPGATLVPEQTGPLIKSSGQFTAGFTPPDYAVVGLIQRRFCYSLTGQTGAGKTVVTLRLAASAAMGIDFAGRETKKTRVLYAAAENPDDVRMRWIALAQHMGFDVKAIDVFFTEGSFSISKMSAKLREEAEGFGGEFGLVIIDTSPAFFEGDDENSRTQMGAHARLMRGLISVIPGGPAVIANCHPVKNAAADNLLPAGGGTYLNEVDGNFTCAKNDSTTEMHWQGKFRGPEFAPLNFLIKTVTHQDLKDSDDRLIPTVICEHLTEQAREEIAAAGHKDEDKLLELISSSPRASYAVLATAMGWKLHSGEPNKMKAKRCLAELKKAKLIKETRGGWTITPAGKSVLDGSEK